MCRVHIGINKARKTFLLVAKKKWPNWLANSVIGVVVGIVVILIMGGSDGIEIDVSQSDSEMFTNSTQSIDIDSENIDDGTSSIAISDKGNVTQNNYIGASTGQLPSQTESGSVRGDSLIFESDFLEDDYWALEKGIIKEGKTISLRWMSDNGYILSRDEFSEHSEINFSFIPKTEAINFFVRLEDAFMVIIGDGDNKEVILKKFSPDNTNWDEVIPLNETSEARPERIVLENPILVDREVKVKMIIDA
ncbi:hypothetical protein KKI23_01560, partial [Patescibacteria group bacterium]|nr:hypothetical protein [Patescibacteria group bacterium]